MNERAWMQLACAVAGILNACVVCKAMIKDDLSIYHGFNLFFAFYFTMRLATI